MFEEVMQTVLIPRPFGSLSRKLESTHCPFLVSRGSLPPPMMNIWSLYDQVTEGKSWQSIAVWGDGIPVGLDGWWRRLKEASMPRRNNAKPIWSSTSIIFIANTASLPSSAEPRRPSPKLLLLKLTLHFYTFSSHGQRPRRRLPLRRPPSHWLLSRPSLHLRRQGRFPSRDIRPVVRSEGRRRERRHTLPHSLAAKEHHL